MKPSLTVAPCALAVTWLGLAAACGLPAPMAGAPAVADTVAADPPHTIAFAQTPSIEVGADPESLVVADFDGDGKPDVALVTWDGVAVVLGKDGLTSSLVRWYPAGNRPRAIVSADFDGDGKPDLAVAAEDGVALLLGNGDGSFQAPRALRAGDDPVAIVAGDFDGDGRPDLAVADARSGDVNVLIGKGGGELGPVRPFPALPGAVMLFAADLDGDGKLDLLAVARADGACAALLGRGDGTFAPAQVVPAEASPGRECTAAAVGDFDGDGKLDLAMTLRPQHAGEAEDLAVRLGRGDGTFEPGPSLPLEPWEWQLALAAGDFDDDGKLDLAVGLDAEEAVLSLHGNGDGTFRRDGAFGVRGGPLAMAAADLDGDGKLDLAVSGNRGTLSVLAGSGDGSFRGERVVVVKRYLERIVTGDVNGDGVPDVVVASDNGVPNVRSSSSDGGGEALIAVLLGDGHGGLVRAFERALGGLDAKAGMALADVDGDGKLDLVCARGGKVLLGHGDGTFGEPRAWSPVQATDLVLGDFHGQGALDMVQTLAGAHGVWLSSGGGDGSFALDREIDVDGKLAAAVAVDLDGDGKLDLAVTTDGGLRVLFGRGDGSFDAPQRFEPSGPLGALAVEDLDGDGRPDLVAARADREASVVLLNAGGRALRTGAPIPMSGKLALRDLDGDGVADLTVQEERVLGFFHGNGDGTFDAATHLSLDTFENDFALADLHRGGLPDLLVFSSYEPTLRLFDNHAR